MEQKKVNQNKSTSSSAKNEQPKNPPEKKSDSPVLEKRTQVTKSELLKEFNALVSQTNEYKTLNETLTQIAQLKARANANDYILSNKTLEQIANVVVIAFAPNKIICDAFIELVNNSNKNELKKLYTHAFNNSTQQAKMRIKELSTNTQATTKFYDKINVKKFLETLYIDFLTNKYNSYIRIDFKTRTIETIDNEQQRNELKQWNEQQKQKEKAKQEQQKKLQELNELKLKKLNEQIASAQEKLDALKGKLNNKK